MKQPAIRAASIGGTVDGTARSLADLGTVPSNAKSAYITVHGQTVRFFYDGTAPTASLGHEAVAGTVIILENREEIDRFKAIREGATSATVSVTFHLREFPDA